MATSVAMQTFVNVDVSSGHTLAAQGRTFTLSGVDAPVRLQGCYRATGVFYPCGLEAARFLREQIGQAPLACVFATQDASTARCQVKGRDLSEIMIRAGYAFPTTSEPALRAAQMDARQAKRGMWQGEFVQPSIFRRKLLTQPAIVQVESGR